MGMLTDDDLRQLLGEAATAYEVPSDGPARVLAVEPAAPAPRRLLLLSSAAAVVVLAVVGGVVLQGRDSGGTTTPMAAAAPSAVEFQVESGRIPLTYGKYQAPVPAAAAPGALADQSTALAKGTAPAPAAAAVDDARVVKKGSIGLLVEDDQVTPTLTRVEGFATALDGVIAKQVSQEAGDTPSGSVTLRVPTGSFEELVQKVRAAAPEVSTSTTSGQDVTAQYADLEAQLGTLKAARARFLTILERANSIGDVLSVQQRVDDVTGKIDRLEGQRRVLAAQSDTATLEVTVTERDDPSLAKVVRPDSGMSKALRDARDGFVHGVETLVRLSGPALLVLLVLGLAVAVLRVGRRAVRRRLL